MRPAVARVSVGAMDEVQVEDEVQRLGLGVESGNVGEDPVVVRVVPAVEAQLGVFREGMSVGGSGRSPSPGTQ